MSNILFTICGRAGSKGCKNKNIRNFLGKPLFEYTFQAIQEFNLHNDSEYKIVVSTDSPEFIEIVKSNHPDVCVVDREKSLSGDNVGKVDVIRDATKKAEKFFNQSFDYVIDLDITSPIRTAKNIKDALNLAISNPEYDCVFSVVKSRRNPYFNMIKYEKGVYSKVLESTFLTRQQAPQMYDMNASIYVYKKSFILDENIHSPLVGNNGIIEMFDTGILDIDNAEDFELMEHIAIFMRDHFEEYKNILY
ncbi:MAG: acylneuraminate cytidylyltransferase family protein [Clostridia bacterium]|nr:acylneuraminate cytidylyltransferase family protein [Clostridia bacterium]